MYRSSRPAFRHLLQVMLLLAFLIKGAVLVAGDVVDGRLDVDRFLLGDSGRRWRIQFQELEELGRGPGRRASADGHIYIDSNKSLCAMGLLQFMVVFILFGDGGGRRRRDASRVVREVRGIVVIFLSARALFDVWLANLYPYPLCTCLYLYASMYAFLLQ
jgi:hypothetical protein